MTISIKDQRGSPASFVDGTLNLSLTTSMESPKTIDEIKYLRTALNKELKARNLPAQVLDENYGRISITVQKFHIRNYQETPESAFQTFAIFKAILEAPDGPQATAVYLHNSAYINRGFKDICEPTLNSPLEVLVKEIVAKLNQIVFKSKLSDRKVKQVARRVFISPGIATSDTVPSRLFVDVYELGFSNNPTAIPYIRRLAEHADESIRLAAISSLGIMKAKEHTPWLISRFTEADTWSERTTILKALGDMRTDEALTFLQRTQLELMAGSELHPEWNDEFFSLYL